MAAWLEVEGEAGLETDLVLLVVALAFGADGVELAADAAVDVVSGAYDPRREWGLLPPYGEHFLAAMEAQVTP